MSRYDTDFYTWTQEQAHALRTKNLAALDLEHLAEEIEDVGNEVRFALERQMRRLLFHLLKLHYDLNPRPRRGWMVSVANAREAIAERAVMGLQAHPGRYLPTAYRRARRDALTLWGWPPTTIPDTCPWSLAQVLNPDFFPEP